MDQVLALDAALAYSVGMGLVLGPWAIGVLVGLLLRVFRQIK